MRRIRRPRSGACRCLDAVCPAIVTLRWRNITDGYVSSSDGLLRCCRRYWRTVSAVDAHGQHLVCRRLCATAHGSTADCKPKTRSRRPAPLPHEERAERPARSGLFSACRFWQTPVSGGSLGGSEAGLRSSHAVSAGDSRSAAAPVSRSAPPRRDRTSACLIFRTAACVRRRGQGLRRRKKTGKKVSAGPATQAVVGPRRPEITAPGASGGGRCGFLLRSNRSRGRAISHRRLRHRSR